MINLHPKFSTTSLNKKKIINDPVYGFITIQSDLIFDIIQHPYFQRLRRIKQLGLSDFVYPGALHTRFHHALGAMHLMTITLDNLRSKGHEISPEEYEAALIAILLHDIGHGPFSHTLEFSLMNGIGHEHISVLLISKLNEYFEGKLTLAFEIFKNKYHRTFFNQLVASQLDIDRLDYLKRDSFFTGVSEGTIGADRIIKMLDIRDGQLVVEEKGIYSIENFLSARRLMYWQVYLHKTSVASEKMMIQLIKRAKWLVQNGTSIKATPAFSIFLERNIALKDLQDDPDLLDVFASLDDYDIWGSVKFWTSYDDKVLSMLSTMLLQRKLFQIVMSNDKIEESVADGLKIKIQSQLGVSEDEANYFIGKGSISNKAYIAEGQTINILTKAGQIVDVATASDLPNIKAMSKIVTKHYLCWPKIVSL